MDIVFAVLPFADVNRPAIGVTRLKSVLAQSGFAAGLEYFNFRLAEMMGLALYLRLANDFSPDLLLGEWFFADAVFGDAIPQPDDYLTKVLGRYCQPQDPLIAEMWKARELREQFLNDCADRLDRLQPKVVGFTTTFHQTCPSLALAKRLKARAHAPIIIFGGANCEGEMGRQMLRSFPWLDYVCSGEAEHSLPALLDRIVRRHPAQPIPGVFERDVAVESMVPELVEDMDGLPLLDYGDYFERVEASPLKPQLAITLMAETARGCWWGAKQKCRFCGLNEDAIRFRSMSPARAFQEISHLARTYHQKKIALTDNILDLKHVPTLFPKLQASGLELELFYEVKANLNYAQLAALRAGGVRYLQPGIESFNNRVLRLMRKGCTGLQNIQLLRWGEELGLEVMWNILAGFPGELPSDYAGMSRLVPLLTHLMPPASCTHFRLDRFSPFFMEQEESGLVRARPAHAYYYVFPMGRRELAKLAYFFEYEHRDGRNTQEYLAELQQEVARWWKLRTGGPEQRPKLDAQLTPDGLVITDTREAATASPHHLTGVAADLYLFCDAAKSRAGVMSHFGGTAEPHVLEGEIAKLLATRLMIEDDGSLLSLAVFRNRPNHPQTQCNHGDLALSQTSPAE